jgi:hypothetical protein
MVEDVMDGDTTVTQKMRLIVSGLVLKNEMYSVCFCSYSHPLLFTLLSIAEDVATFLFTTFLDSTPRKRHLFPLSEQFTISKDILCPVCASEFL